MYHVLKRIIDFVVSLVSVIILPPLFAVISLAIKLDSRGPVFFKQKRFGKNKICFNILKFRTMLDDAPKDIRRHLFSNSSEYLTKVGRFSRKTSLDELPQLLNILAGQMSPDWKSHNFSGYGTVFHVVGIAHIKETPKNRDLYFKVNKDLTLKVANLAKDFKVNHFIFLRSMSVYGIDEGVITKSTKEQPKTAYGISKLEAKILLKSIESRDFKVAILRPSMLYGDGCKGNYNTLIHFAERFPFFPSIRNKRSMLFIDTLCEFVKDIINRNANGLFFRKMSNILARPIL